MKYVILTFLFVWLACSPVFAATSVVINEFQTSSPQTVELYNNGTHTIDLSGWYLDDSGGSTYYVIPDETILPVRTCISFEASFGLNAASADSVRLFDSTAAPTATNAHIVDSFSYDKISDTTKNHQRIPDGSSIWVTAAPSIDMLNLTGAPCSAPPSPTPTATPTKSPTPTKTPSPLPTAPVLTTYSTPPTYENIYITEVVANPKSGQPEWVELFNNNDTAVILENWKIDDIFEAGASPYPFFLFIAARSYGVLDLHSSMFNNDGDSVRLIDRNGLQKDNLEYHEVIENYSISRNNLANGAACLTVLSRGAPNNPCITTTGTAITASQAPPRTTAIPSKQSAVQQPQPTVKPQTSQNDTARQTAYAEERATDNDYIAPHMLGSSTVSPVIRGLYIVSIMCSLLTISVVLSRMKVW